MLTERVRPSIHYVILKLSISKLLHFPASRFHQSIFLLCFASTLPSILVKRQQPRSHCSFLCFITSDQMFGTLAHLTPLTRDKSWRVMKHVYLIQESDLRNLFDPGVSDIRCSRFRNQIFLKYTNNHLSR